MSPLPAARQSLSSEGDPNLPVDSRKMKRTISNRESARRSRMRKQQHLEDLTKQIAALQSENASIRMHINLYTEQYHKIDGDNTILRTQLIELTKRLRSLNSILKLVEEFSGEEIDIPEIPDPMLSPWQLPRIAQPIMASADMFQF